MAFSKSSQITRPTPAANKRPSTYIAATNTIKKIGTTIASLSSIENRFRIAVRIGSSTSAFTVCQIQTRITIVSNGGRHTPRPRHTALREGRRRHRTGVLEGARAHGQMDSLEDVARGTE